MNYWLHLKVSDPYFTLPSPVVPREKQKVSSLSSSCCFVPKTFRAVFCIKSTLNPELLVHQFIKQQKQSRYLALKRHSGNLPDQCAHCLGKKADR